MRVVQFLVRLRPAFEVLSQTTPRAPGMGAVGKCGTLEHCWFFNSRRNMWYMEANSNLYVFKKTNNVHLYNVAPLPYCIVFKISYWINSRTRNIFK